MSKATRDPVCGMTVSPDKSFHLTVGYYTEFFCSRRCLETYAKEHDLPADRDDCAPARPRAWYLDKTLVVCAALAVLVVVSYAWSPLVPFRVTLLMYLSMIFWSVLLGLLIGGLLERFVPREYISLLLSQRRKRTILSSVFLGFLMSACSHGVLALAIELYKKGASTPVVVSFLLASPWANLPITFLLFGFFGLKALYIVLGALLVALTTGIVFQFLERKGLVESNPHTLKTAPDFSILKDIRARARGYRPTWAGVLSDLGAVLRGALDLARMTLWWILLGIALSSLVAAFVPPEFLRQHLTPTLWGLLITLLFATIIEVCSEGTAPLAFEIFKQTGAFGNSFVFLMAGVVTDYTEIGLLWSNIGKRTALWLPVVAVPQVMALGYLANRLF